MDFKPKHNSPVLTESVLVNKARMGLSSKMVPYSAPAGGYSSSGLYLTIPRRKPSKLDDVCANGWLDAMQSSSPPRKRPNMEFSFDSDSDEAAIAYRTWVVRASTNSTLVLKLCHSWIKSYFLEKFM